MHKPNITRPIGRVPLFRSPGLAAIGAALLLAGTLHSGAQASPEGTNRFQGFHIGLSGRLTSGHTRIGAEEASARGGLEGAGVGVMAGHSWRWRQFVYGLEANLRSAPRPDRFDIVFAPNDVVHLGMSGSLQGDVRFRVGYVMGPVLVHGALGYGMTRLAFSGSDGISSAWSRMTIPFWLASIGVDVPVTDHLFMRAALESSIGRASEDDLPGVGAASITLREHRAVVGVGVRF